MMNASKVSSLLHPETWRRLWNKLREIEAALATSEADILDRRLSRLEAEVNALRVNAGAVSVATKDQAIER